MTETTDWDAYYKKPTGPVNLTRALTRARLVKVLNPYISKRVSVCELGGANSCVISKLCETFTIDHYHVRDTNRLGLSMLPQTCHGTKVSHALIDILEIGPDQKQKFDVVLSIGLIEHFDVSGTKKAIEAHMFSAKPGGIVLITFPTPTLIYRIIRRCAEWLGIWAFHDERPLRPEEVLDVVKTHGEVLHCSINWWIGLTQFYVLAKVNG